MNYTYECYIKRLEIVQIMNFLENLHDYDVVNVVCAQFMKILFYAHAFIQILQY